MTDKIVVLSTCGSTEEADRVARRLVETRLAACVNIAPSVRSIYHWQGAIEESTECLLIIKSRRDLLDAVEIELRKAHSYEVPEIVALSVVDGSEAYFGWMDRELRSAD